MMQIRGDDIMQTSQTEQHLIPVTYLPPAIAIGADCKQLDDSIRKDIVRRQEEYLEDKELV